MKNQKVLQINQPFIRSMGLITILLVSLLPAGCSTSKLPTQKLSQFQSGHHITIQNDTVTFKLNNPLNCPLRFSISSPEKHLADLVSNFDTITVGERREVEVQFPLPGITTVRVNIRGSFGDLSRTIVKKPLVLPFPKGKTYRVVQGYDSPFSHNNPKSRFAIDFDLKVGDTVSSAGDGFVVGVIKDYKSGGSTKALRDNDFSNFITIYHPSSGLFTQYVHLQFDGSFVKVGDPVRKGQPIGLVGMTGFTTVPHLHFNVLRPDPIHELISTEAVFENGLEGGYLKEGTIIGY